MSELEIMAKSPFGRVTLTSAGLLSDALAVAAGGGSILRRWASYMEYGCVAGTCRRWESGEDGPMCGNIFRK